MIGPNLSDWALKHRSFTVFAMISIVVAGLSSYFRLGRSEDPAFTFRTMIVQAAWPGATLDDTLTQVTERLERKLQETKGLDFLRSYTSPGLTTIFVNLKGSTSAICAGPRPRAWSAPASTMISATPTASFTLSPLTASRGHPLGQWVSNIRWVNAMISKRYQEKRVNGSIAGSTGSPQSAVKSRAQTSRGAGVTGPRPVNNGRRGS
jgi:hypothetical protein